MPLVETKVKASTAAAASSGLILYVLGKYVFVGSVPDVVASWVYATIPALITLAAGYAARHTYRPPPRPPKTLVQPPGTEGHP